MKSLIIGYGEVGNAIFEVIRPHHETFIRDVNDLVVSDIEVLHLCYPDSDKFIEYAKKYIKQYDPHLTIIHSSVKPGTTGNVSGDAVYSPVRGRHRPSLAAELPEFIKFVAGFDSGITRTAARYLQGCGFNTYETNDVAGLELVKLLSNIHMGIEIAWAQEVQRLLKRYCAKDNTYRAWEETYQDGYLKLLQSNLVRPIMNPDPIGGHCILECTEILKNKYKSELFDFIIESNERAKDEKEKKADSP